MRKVNLFISLGIIFFMFGCEGPEANPDNPDVRVINGLEERKISKLIVNSQLFLGPTEYLMPGEVTEYKKVDASDNIMLSYRWENVNNPADSGETGKLFLEEGHPGFQELQSYTIRITTDTLYMRQP
jgi:hypothetical protein